MKSKLFVIILIGFFGSISSCSEKILNVEPAGSLTENVFYDKADDFNRSVLGIYAKSVWLYQSFVCCSGYSAGDPHYSLVLMADDDLTDQNDNPINRFDVNPTQGTFRDAFRLIYQGVFRANVVLQKLDEKAAGVIAAEQMTQKQADTYRAEALFLRSYAYWLAWNIWETAPIVNERFTSFDEISTPNSDGTAILNLIKTDLDKAEDLLPVGPTGWAANDRGRVTSGGAKALLGKVLLALSDYSGAAAKLAEIEPQGHRLMPNFSQNFRLNSENNEESLFELQWGQSPGFTNGFLDNDFFDVVGTVAGNRTMMTIGYNGGRGYLPSASIQTAFTPGDPRRKWTFFEVADTVGQVTKDGRLITTIYRAGQSATGSHVAKYLRGDGQDARQGAYPAATDNADYNNERVIRLADVILMRAEALLESGGSTQEVVRLINRIRERARNSTGTGVPAAQPADRNVNETNRTTIHGWIREERRLELAFEGHRLWDLNRWHRAKKIDLKSWNWGSRDVTWEETNLRFPFPQSEVDINPGLKQNQGY